MNKRPGIIGSSARRSIMTKSPMKIKAAAKIKSAVARLAEPTSWVPNKRATTPKDRKMAPPKSTLRTGRSFFSSRKKIWIKTMEIKATGMLI